MVVAEEVLVVEEVAEEDMVEGAIGADLEAKVEGTAEMVLVTVVLAKNAEVEVVLAVERSTTTVQVRMKVAEAEMKAAEVAEAATEVGEKEKDGDKAAAEKIRTVEIGAEQQNASVWMGLETG